MLILKIVRVVSICVLRVLILNGLRMADFRKRARVFTTGHHAGARGRGSIGATLEGLIGAAEIGVVGEIEEAKLVSALVGAQVGMLIAELVVVLVAMRVAKWFVGAVAGLVSERFSAGRAGLQDWGLKA